MYRLTAQQMTVRILNGGYNMPAYGGILKAEEVHASGGFSAKPPLMRVRLW